MDVGAVDDALRLLRRGSQLAQKLKAFFDLHGTTSTRFMAMIVIDLAAEQEGVLPGDLAARLDVSRTVATEAINALVRRGLLASASTGGARARRVRLTCHGRAVLAAQLPDYLSLMADFMHRDPRRFGERNPGFSGTKENRGCVCIQCGLPMHPSG